MKQTPTAWHFGSNSVCKGKVSGTEWPGGLSRVCSLSILDVLCQIAQMARSMGILQSFSFSLYVIVTNNKSSKATIYKPALTQPLVGPGQCRNYQKRRSEWLILTVCLCSSTFPNKESLMLIDLDSCWLLLVASVARPRQMSCRVPMCTTYLESVSEYK